MKNNRFGILAVVILAAAAIVLAIIGPKALKKESTQINAPVQGQANGAKGQMLTSKGLVESEQEIELGSQVKGVITEMKIDEGAAVKRGQPLVMLDGSKILQVVQSTEAGLGEAKAHLKELESGYRAEDIDMAKSRAARAQALYEKAKDEYERQKRLYEKDAATLIELEKAEERMKVTDEELREAKTNLLKLRRGAREEEMEQAEAVVRKAQAELNYNTRLLKDYTLTSPIDGLVVQRFKDAGETVDVGTPVLKVIDPSKMRIRAELEETDIGKVAEGRPVEVTTDAYANKTYQGKVYKVLPAVKRKAQRTFDPMASFDINAQDIYIRLDDFSGLKSGMTVTVRFQR